MLVIIQSPYVQHDIELGKSFKSSFLFKKIMWKKELTIYKTVVYLTSTVH